jgi:hypothetical protein
MHSIKRNVEGLLVGVVIDRRVVDEDIEAVDPGRQSPNAVFLADVELRGNDVGVDPKVGGGPFGAVKITCRQPDSSTEPGASCWLPAAQSRWSVSAETRQPSRSRTVAS